jgi:prevent-host-death family protein
MVVLLRGLERASDQHIACVLIHNSSCECLTVATSSIQCSYNRGRAISMEMIAGVRDLKNKLSHYLREVKKGRSIMITERGKIVATIVPAHEHPDAEKLKKLARSGLGTWRGESPKALPGPSWLKGNRWEILSLRSDGDSLLGY